MTTEETYIGWIRRYILFHNKRHPREMGVAVFFRVRRGDEKWGGTGEKAVIEKEFRITVRQFIKSQLYLDEFPYSICGGIVQWRVPFIGSPAPSLAVKTRLAPART